MKPRLFVLAAIAIALAWLSVDRTRLNAIGQEPTPALPMVSAAPVPFYPPVARATNTQGVVHVNIRTDGHKVIEAHAEEKPGLLSTAAEENAKKWEFSLHTPVSFAIIYRYKLADECNPNNPTVTIHLPTEVEVCQHTFRTADY
jgi:hypothetical protein